MAVGGQIRPAEIKYDTQFVQVCSKAQSFKLAG